jgi:hypothetical protein
MINAIRYGAAATTGYRQPRSHEVDGGIAALTPSGCHRALSSLLESRFLDCAWLGAPLTIRWATLALDMWAYRSKTARRSGTGVYEARGSACEGPIHGGVLNENVENCGGGRGRRGYPCCFPNRFQASTKLLFPNLGSSRLYTRSAPI